MVPECDILFTVGVQVMPCATGVLELPRDTMEVGGVDVWDLRNALVYGPVVSIWL